MISMIQHAATVTANGQLALLANTRIETDSHLELSTHRVDDKFFVAILLKDNTPGSSRAKSIQHKFDIPEICREVIVAPSDNADNITEFLIPQH